MILSIILTTLLNVFKISYNNKFLLINMYRKQHALITKYYSTYNIWRKNNTINNLHFHSNEYGSGCLKKLLLSSRNYSEHAKKTAVSNLFIVGHLFYKAPVEVFLIAVEPSFGLWIWKRG